MWNLKNKANEHILYNKQKQTHSTENKLLVSGWEREQGMEKTGVYYRIHCTAQPLFYSKFKWSKIYKNI